MDNHKVKRNKKNDHKVKQNKKKQQTAQNTSKLKELSVILHASYPTLIQYDEMLQLRPEKKYKLQLIIEDKSSTKSDCRSNKISHILKNTVLTNTKVPQHTLKSTVSRRSKLNTSTSVLSPDKSDLTYDNLPEAQSIYRNHEHLWDFYADLEKLKKGLEYEAYDYVIDILVKYVAKQDDILFVRACCNRFSKEIKRTNHLINIIERTGEKYFSMRKILDII